MRGRKVRNALKATQAEQYSNASIPLLLKIVIDRVFEVDLRWKVKAMFSAVHRFVHGILLVGK